MKFELCGWHVWIGCHAEFISASHEILNQVQDDISDGPCDGLGFVSPARRQAGISIFEFRIYGG
jgi:hypothetical protein